MGLACQYQAFLRGGGEGEGEGEGKGEKRKGRPDTKPFRSLCRKSEFWTLALIGRNTKGYVTPPETKIIMID